MSYANECEVYPKQIVAMGAQADFKSFLGTLPLDYLISHANDESTIVNLYLDSLTNIKETYIMTSDDRSIFAISDEEAFNRVMPRWAQLLNRVYDTVFAPLNRFTDHLNSAKTYRLIAKGEYEYDMSEVFRDNMDTVLKGMVVLDSDRETVEPDPFKS